MARLTKPQIAAHTKAEALLATDRKLSDDEREFILDNWNEGARHINSAAGAFFTPFQLALDAACYAVWYRESPPRVLDLCAGIGALGLACLYRSGFKAQITCLEVNPDYCEVGRRVLPEARWINASADALPADLGTFDVVISNPPFGHSAKINGPRFRGDDDLSVVDIASDLAGDGVFILPVGSLPFSFSGRHYQEKECERYNRFNRATGIELECSSIDCAYFADQWRGVRPQIEIVNADFDEARERRQVAQAA